MFQKVGNEGKISFCCLRSGDRICGVGIIVKETNLGK